MTNIRIPYEDLGRVNKPYFELLLNKAKSTIENGWYVLGNEVSSFEENFSKMHNNQYCVGVASGLDALMLGLSVYEFKLGSKVLVQSNTYIATILAIVKCGMVPVLVEPDIHTFNMNIEDLEKAYDNNCVAIAPVHMYGRISQMEEIMRFAKAKNLIVIEDCAQSHFAELNGKRAGTFGDIGAFSFYPSKNLGALGDGGAIICHDEKVYHKLKALRNYGSHKKYHNDYIGINSRLDEIQASFLNCKLPFYRDVINHKSNLAAIYFKHLSNVIELQLPSKPSKGEHVWHIFNIIFEFRDELKEFLIASGIATEIHYPIPPHLQFGYKDIFVNQYFPISEFIHKNTLSLPISTIHSEEDIIEVCYSIKAGLNHILGTNYSLSEGN
ncbi:DegT/DnrJ/EryC1/StrS family aminotransferase [Aquirufa lenticrescens]